MKRLVLAIVALAALTLPLSASGLVAIYGIIDKVVFEPNERNAERLQVWGAFAYTASDLATRSGSSGLTISAAKRGYLYFKIRSPQAGFTTEPKVEATRIEWSDLKAIAGTGQAVGFGRWGYFGSLRPDTGPDTTFIEWAPNGGQSADLRVRPASETPANPATYQAHIGLIKLDANGRHAAIVKVLREAK